MRSDLPGGTGRLEESSTARDPLPVTFLSPSCEKTDLTVSAAVQAFLADLRLSGSERVLGAIAVALANGLEAAPLYAQTKFARELREILGELREAETKPETLRLLEGVEL